MSIDKMRIDRYNDTRGAVQYTRDTHVGHDFFRAIQDTLLVAYAVSRGNESERDADYAIFCDLVALNRVNI